MLLRNGKNYQSFSWSKTIYLSRLKVSKAMLTPISLFKNNFDDVHLVIRRSDLKKEICRNGIGEQFIDDKGRLRITLFSDYERKILFFQLVADELSRNNIKSSLSLPKL